MIVVSCVNPSWTWAGVDAGAQAASVSDTPYSVTPTVWTSLVWLRALTLPQMYMEVGARMLNVKRADSMCFQVGTEAG